MFAMDFTIRGRAWIEEIGEKLENLCSEVDARSQEQLGFVESQLQIAGANLKQFCLEIIQEILPASLSDAEEQTSNLSAEQNTEEHHPASELSNISVQEDDKDELFRSNSSSLELAVKTAEGVHVDSSVQSQADKVMKMSVEGAFVDHHGNEPAIDSVPEVEFDGNCVLVYKDDLSSGSEFHGAHFSHKKNMPRLKVKPVKQRNQDATKCEDVSVELELSNAECKTKSSPNVNLELSQEGFCESDWEII
ncbi:unnamed protein product [Withania somnifera]